MLLNFDMMVRTATALLMTFAAALVLIHAECYSSAIDSRAAETAYVSAAQW